MKDFRPLWNELAANKQITTAHVIQRCILIGMHKGQTFEEKVQFATQKLSRAFTPKRKNPVCVYEWLGKSYIQVEHPYYALEYNLKYYAKSNRGLCRDLDLTDDEGVVYDKIVEAIQKNGFDGFNTHYSHILLFGDLIPEQRCIQMGHAMLKMGQILEQQNAFPPGVTADNLHFCMLDGPDNIEKLVKTNIPYVSFEDYDYSFDDEGNLIESPLQTLKAIVTYPVHWSRRGELANSELYRFQSDGSD